MSPAELAGRARYLTHRLTEKVAERVIGLDTRDGVRLASLGVPEHELISYEPTPYLAFLRVMLEVPAGPEDVFLDYGAGKGRVVSLAALRPYRRVIGVELTAELSALGRANLARARGLRARSVEIVTADATTYDPPDEVTVFHLYNPFYGSVLARVVERMRASLARRPRPITIVFGNPGHFEKLLATDPWAHRVREVPWPLFDHHDPEANRYRIYRAGPGQ